MGQESSNFAHFPPGERAPTAEDTRARLRSPEHLAKLNAAKAEYYALPLEERRARREAKQQEKARRKAEREAKKAGGASAGAPDSAPPTVRSQRATTAPPPDSVPARPGATLGALHGLIDLCAVTPLGDGTCFIQVERVKPVTAFNMNVGGVQRPIWEPIDDAEFSTQYGGGDYVLRAYAVRDDGRNKAISEPVKYRVAGPVNTESLLSQDDIMRPNPAPNGQPALRRPGVMSPHVATAEAQMHDRSLTHQERENERREERRLRDRRESEERDAERRASQLDAARLLEDSHRAERERAERAREREIEMLQAQRSNQDIAELIKAIRPGEETASLTRQHAAELRQLTESHKEEMLRQADAARAELQRLQEAHASALQRVEDHAREERARADGLVREAERRSTEAIREAERRAAERVTDIQGQSRLAYEDIKTRGEERLRDQSQQWQQRFDDLKSSHEREISRKNDEIMLMRSNLESGHQMILSNKDAEIKRLHADLREARDAAEKNKDWVSRMKEAEKQAEALGYVKEEAVAGGGEEDVKTIALKAGLGALQRLPEMISSAGDAIAKVRNPGVPPELARAQVRSGMQRGSGMRTMPRTMAAPRPVPQLSFATEDGGYVPPEGSQPPRPPPPQFLQAHQPMPTMQTVQEPPIMAQDPEPMAAPPPEAMVPVSAPAAAMAPAPPPPAPDRSSMMPPSMAPAPAAPQEAPSVPPPAGAAEGLNPMAQAIITQLSPTLAQAVEQRADPALVAQTIIDAEREHIELVRMGIQSITIDQVIDHIASSPGNHAVLVTRDGRKFLRTFWKRVVELVNA